MAFSKRREYLFIYSVKDANPNGDPLDANHPRYDEETGQILVSDVRVKRTVRDQWLREGKNVFVDGDCKTLADRVKELKSKFGVDTGEDALARCIDSRLFGATYALGKESFSWTGPVQFKWGRSLHRSEAKLVQGTAAFATKSESEQRSFRNEYIVPFTLIGVYGIANQYPSKETDATDSDLDELTSALWKGTTNLITRSKVGHTPRFLMEATYVEGFDGAVGSMDEKVVLKSLEGNTLSDDEQLALRSLQNIRVDMTYLVAKLVAHVDDVEKIRIFTDGELKTDGMEELGKAFGEKLNIGTR
ncbi:MAG: CRISPR-associated protein, Csh2 family [Synergistales bacterium 53_16]|nr:MAG: CRISPR-associated protein, Csh2 family [Synergistales bacterium 53_16]KUL01913.1 MAG: CRISPR-associated protein, Csh2 family [Synergistales bacterium 54_9]